MAHVAPNPTFPVQYLILHSTNTPPHLTPSTADITRQHRASGCLQNKYHFIIERDGTVGNARPVNQPGLHANKQYNKCSIGICLVGGMGKDGKGEDNYTETQIESLLRLAGNLQDEFPGAKVVGWYELSQSPNETSPHFDVEATCWQVR